MELKWSFVNTKDTKINQAMGAELRAERSAVDITVEALASESGISVSTLKRVLKGSVDIGIPQIAAIAAALDAHRDHPITPQDLVRKAVERAGGYEVLMSEVSDSNVTQLHPRSMTAEELDNYEGSRAANFDEEASTDEPE